MGGGVPERSGSNIELKLKLKVCHLGWWGAGVEGW